jgi:hypothetical protein
MLIAASFGFMIGWTGGDETRRRKSAEQQLDQLRETLQQSQPEAQPIMRMFKQQRGILSDIHKRIMAVSKGLQNRLDKPHKINGRISPIRLFHKVWVGTHAVIGNPHHHARTCHPNSRFRQIISSDPLGKDLETC